MTVDMNDSYVAIDLWSDTPYIWVPQTMITATNYWKRSRAKNIGNSLTNLIKSLFYVARDNKDITGIA